MTMVFDMEKLWQLRNQIHPNSLYYADFNNKFGVERHACSAFFEGYLDFVGELMSEDGKENVGDKFFDYFEEYDTPENLWDWYLCHDEECLPVDKDWAADEMSDKAENLLISLVYSKEWKNEDSDCRYTDIEDTIMGVIKTFEVAYPELKNEDNGDLKWYDEAREHLIWEFEDYCED